MTKASVSTVKIQSEFIAPLSFELKTEVREVIRRKVERNIVEKGRIFFIRHVQKVVHAMQQWCAPW